MRNTRVWGLALAAGLLASPAWAQPPAAGQQAAPATERYVVGTAVPEPTPGSELMNLTLEEAMDLALEKNLELKAARLNPAGIDYQLQAARAAFNPTLTGTYSYNDRSTANTSTLEQRSTVNTKSQQYNVGVSKTMPWYGGRLTANFNNSRSFTNSSQLRVNPSFQANVQFNYAQPLLSGFHIDQARNQLRTLSVQRQIADIQLLTTIENTKASVRTAYWNLRQTIDAIEIQRRSLELAQQLFQDNQTKVEIGTLAPIETTTSETQVANAEQALLNAQIQWRNAEQALKRLLAAGPDDEVYRATINPIEQATLSAESVDIPAAVQAALDQRTDLVQARRNLEVSNLNLEVTAESLRPTLDLSAGYSARGDGGSPYSSVFKSAVAFDYPTWNVGFNFSYPLFQRAAKANYARAQLQIDQAQAQLKAQELQVNVDVTNAGLAVENTFKQFQAAQKAREVAERNADAEQTRFDVGMSTNYNVVQAQNNLTSQRLAELRALISYLNAVAEFDRIQRVGR